jgi:hypothetical protein
LQSAQNQLGDLIDYYLSDYAKNLVWERDLDYLEITEPDVVTRVGLWAVKQQIEGGRALIPDEILESLKNNAYIKIGSHLFYVEKTRNKITEIAIPPEKLSQFKKLKMSKEELDLEQQIRDITGHTPKGDVVSGIKDTDPLQIQFSKHAMLALQEAEDLVQNLGELAAGMAHYINKDSSDKKKEKISQDEPDEKKEEISQDGPDEKKEEISQDEIEAFIDILLNSSAIMDPVNLALQKAQQPSTGPDDNPAGLLEEARKFAIDRASKIPGLQKIFNATKPLHYSLIMQYLMPAAVASVAPAAAAPIATYYGIVNALWYSGVALKGARQYQTARDFIIAKRDGVLRPWQKLSAHCEAMIKIARQANLPDAAIEELEVLRANMAKLQGTALFNPTQSPELFSTKLMEFSQTLAEITKTYFTYHIASLDFSVENFSESTHEIELAHHLRFGVLSENLGVQVDESELQQLQDKYEAACKAHPIIQQKYDDMKALSDQLALYQSVGNKFTEGDSAWRKAGFNKADSPFQKAARFAWKIAGYTASTPFEKLTPEQFEENIAFLLKKLAELKTNNLFESQEALQAVDALEDQLIKHLSLKKKDQLNIELEDNPNKNLHFENLEKKVFRALHEQHSGEVALNSQGLRTYAATMFYGLRKESEQPNPWPPKELTDVLAIIDHEKQKLAEQLLEQTKYKEALDVYGKLKEKEKEKQNAEAKQSPTRMATVTDVLKKTREKLEHRIKHLFSDHANSTFLNNPINKTDPAFIEAIKHCVGALKNAERIARKMDTFLTSLQTNKLHAAWILPSISRDLIVLSQHVAAIIELAKESGMENAKIEELVEINQLLEKIRKDPDNAQAQLSEQLEKMSGVITKIVSPLIGTQRPAAPVTPEQKYERPDEKLNQLEVQAKNESLPLIEHLRSSMKHSQELHQWLEEFLQNAKAKDIHIDPKQEKLITDTLAALNDAKIDEDGYFLYNETETPFSRSLKALYNASWAANESLRGFSEHSGALAPAISIAQAFKHSPKLLSYAGEIQWAELGNHSDVLSTQLVNAMLVYSTEKIFQPLERLANITHKIELQNELRLGVLTEPVRSSLDTLEQVFHARNLGTFVNPFSYDPATEEMLEVYLNDAKKRNDTNAVNKYKDAIEEHQKMRRDFAIRCLQRDGLIVLMEAVSHGQADENQNIEQKRKLAILLADINLSALPDSRKDHLRNAHTLTTQFIKTPPQIKEFIEKIIEIDPVAGYALALEATLAGYIEFDPAHFSHAIDSDTHQKNLIHILDRLEVEQVLSMLAKKDSTATAVFLTLLEGETPSKENVDTIKNIISSSPAETEKENLVLLICARYRKLEMDNPPEKIILMNKIGLFLGRLACADAEIARIIFADETIAAVLKTECKGSPALYYEAMVNTFECHYVGQKHELENRTANEFIDANRATILKIYKAVSSKEMDDNAIITACKENPILLLAWTEQFIKEKISKNSTAEEKLSEFCSAFILCTDNQAIRQKMLTQQQKAYGSKSAAFLELLTPEASRPFWEHVRKDLQTESYKAVLDAQLSDFIKTIKSKEDLNENQKKEMIQQATTFIKEQKLELSKITSSLRSSWNKQLEEKVPGGQMFKKIRLQIIKKNRNYNTNCRHAVQEINRIKENVAKKLQGLETKTRLQILHEQLKEIDKFFEEYLKAREEKSLLEEFDLGERKEKRALAQETRKAFQNLSIQVKLAIDNPEKAMNNYEDCSRIAILLVNELQQDKAASSGELRKTAAKAHSLFAPSPPQEKAFSISQILEKIKAFFLNQESAPIPETKNQPRS